MRVRFYLPETVKVHPEPWLLDFCGRGQPLSLTLSFGEIPWFDVRGEIQRCDWSKRTHSLEMYPGLI
jgi:hypothetical protein